MAKLSRGASGLRHLRWAREIVATLDAHVHHNYLLTPTEIEAIANEATLLKQLLQGMHEAVKPYRDFLETAHVAQRGKARVGFYLHRGATPEERGTAAALRNRFDRERATVEQPRRRLLKAALERAIGGLREGLAQMEARLLLQFPPDFVDSLYPELTQNRTMVVDEDDDDDDASSPPA
jgi:hypothetical protein